MSKLMKAMVVVGVLLLLAAIAGACGFLAHIAKPRVVARAITPEGVEMCVVQHCNWNAELFTTAFYYHQPGTNWGWFYYDHEDGYWGSGRVKLDTNARVAVIYRGNQPAITFDWATETYTLQRWKRTITGAQQYMPAGWSPPSILTQP